MIIDPATVRNKLREYTTQGMILSEKKGRTMYYRWDRQEADLSAMREAILFFSEADPLGVIGSFLLDRESRGQTVQTPFSFKHHYIVHALESEIFCQGMQAISEERTVEIRFIDRRKREMSERVVPLRIMVSLQGGRRYLSAYNLREQHILNYRLDSIQAICYLEHYKETDVLQAEFERSRSWMNRRIVTLSRSGIRRRCSLG